MESKLVVSTRIKPALMALGCACFAAISAFAIPETWAYWGLAFFGLGVPILGWTVYRPFVLELNNVGFRLSGGTLRKEMVVDWRDLEVVTAYRLPKGRTMVGFRYRADAKARQWGAAASRTLSGMDGGLPGSWPMGTMELAKLMESYRRAALQG